MSSICSEHLLELRQAGQYGSENIASTRLPLPRCTFTARSSGSDSNVDRTELAQALFGEVAVGLRSRGACRR